MRSFLLLAAAFFMPAVASAEVVRTEWIGGADGSWFEAANWSNGVADNVEGQDFRAVVDTTRTLGIGAGQEATVEGLDFLSGKIDVRGRLTVEGTTVLPESGNPFAYVQSNAAEGIFFDMGSVPQLDGGVLKGVSLSAIIFPWAKENSAVIQWKNANIREIATGNAVEIRGFNSAIQDSVTGLSAFRGLSKIDGRFSVNYTSATIGNSLTISAGGTLATTTIKDLRIEGSLTNDGMIDSQTTGNLPVTADTSLITVTGGVTNRGTLKIVDTAGEALKMKVGGDMTNTGNVQLVSAVVPYPNEVSGLEINGRLVNSGRIEMARSRSGLSAVLVKVAGEFENTGEFIAEEGGLRTSFLRNKGIINMNGGYEGGNPFAVTGNVENEGSLSVWLRGTVSGDFSNSGTLELKARNPEGRFTISGHLMENVDGELTKGTIRMKEDESTFSTSGTISWKGARIEKISAGAMLELLVYRPRIEDVDTKADALAGIRENAGVFRIAGQLSTAGDFSNSGTFANVSIRQTANLMVNGRFHNSGNATLEGRGTLHQVLENSGTLRLATGASAVARDVVTNTGTVELGNGASLVGEGGWAQNVDGHLTAGSLVVSGILSWKGADIRVIDEGAALALAGSRAFIRDSTDGLNAVGNLERNEGRLSLSSHLFKLKEGFVNNGLLELANGGASVEGNASQGDDGMLAMKLFRNGDATQVGYMEVDGEFDLDGDLRIVMELVAGTFSAEAVYTIVDADGITGAFDNVAWGERLVTSDGLGSFVVDKVGGDVMLSGFAAVPEPGVYVLAMLGAGVVFVMERKRRKREQIVAAGK